MRDAASHELGGMMAFLLAVEAGDGCAGCAVNDDLVDGLLDACKVVCERVQVCLCFL